MTSGSRRTVVSDSRPVNGKESACTTLNTYRSNPSFFGFSGLIPATT